MLELIEFQDFYPISSIDIPNLWIIGQHAVEMIGGRSYLPIHSPNVEAAVMTLPLQINK